MTTVHREVLGDISNMKMGPLSPLKSTGSPYRKPRGVCKASSLAQTPNKKLFTQDILSPLLLPPKSAEDPEGSDGKIKEHADRLKMRLQLALYKINTKQTNVSLAALEEASSSKTVGATETPMRAPPGSLLKGTPASMGAAKSLLQLGNC